jgi:hypothetical protein
MNNLNILDIIAVYGSAFIILLLLIVTFIVRNKRANKEKRRRETAILKTTAPKLNKPVTYPLNGSGIPDRMLPSSNITEKSMQNSVIKNMEYLSTLKRGIMWAEILGKPGGRRQRNT